MSAIFRQLFELRGDLPKRLQILCEIVGVSLILVAWQLIAMFQLIPTSLLPAPTAIIMSLPELHFQDALVRNLAYSYKLNALGLLEAVAITLPLGFAIGLQPWMRAVCMRYINTARFMPLAALTGVFIALFHIGDNMKVQFLAFSIFVYLLPVVIQRIDEVDKVYHQTAFTCGASNWKIVRTVFLPGAVSRVFDDIRVLGALSWTYITIAELVNANDGGIGVIIWKAGRTSQTDKMFMALIVLFIAGYLQDRLEMILDKALFPSKYVQRGGLRSARQPKDTASPPSSATDAVVFSNTDLPDVIELRDVSQTYDGGQTWTIKGLNLLIEDRPDKGQFVVILGESGCGKSTLLRYISGLQDPTEGKVIIEGKHPERTDPIAMVFQQYSSFPWYTVLQNVMLPLLYAGVSRKEARERALAMIEKVGLTGHEKKYAQHPTLSGGQLQRVAIARSLVANPRILLMDEPFGALDLKTRLKAQLLLRKLWTDLQSTVVFVTHDIQEAVFLADEIWIMAKDPGRIVQRVVIDLPDIRTAETRRDPRFMPQVYQVEDLMNAL